jgi:hypothetical protein
MASLARALTGLARALTGPARAVSKGYTCIEKKTFQNGSVFGWIVYPFIVLL